MEDIIKLQTREKERNSMEEKKYLKNRDKVFYGMGDFASNIFSVTIGSFVLIYLTNIVGLNSAVVGTLMLISKVLDGVTDVIFGSLLDRTHSKMGKARPWMFWSTLLLGIFLVLNFTIPQMEQTLQYGYFFVVYVLFNAVCYTANNIAYSTLSALMTKNGNERVQLGTIRYIFAFSSVMLVSGFTMQVVNYFGGGASGWRKMALTFAFVAVIINTLSCLLVKELPEEEVAVDSGKADEQKTVGLGQTFAVLVKNKYYLSVLGIYICFYTATGLLGGMGVYYTQYILQNAGLMAPFSMAINMPTILGLFFVPVLVKKFGIYRTNFVGMVLATLAGIPIVICGFRGIVPVLVACFAIRSLCSASLMGTLNAVIARISEYVWKKDKLHIEGSMYSCSSMGIKVGGGIGSAACGWLLALGGFDGQAAIQSAAANSVITISYCVIPVVFFALIAVFCKVLNVEKAIAELDEK